MRALFGFDSFENFLNNINEEYAFIQTKVFLFNKMKNNVVDAVALELFECWSIWIYPPVSLL